MRQANSVWLTPWTARALRANAAAPRPLSASQPFVQRLMRRANNRIEHSHAFTGELGAVSPGMLDGFSARVVDRFPVQAIVARYARPDQANEQDEDAPAMPLATFARGEFGEPDGEQNSELDETAFAPSPNDGRQANEVNEANVASLPRSTPQANPVAVRHLAKINAQRQLAAQRKATSVVSQPSQPTHNKAERIVAAPARETTHSAQRPVRRFSKIEEIPARPSEMRREPAATPLDAPDEAAPSTSSKSSSHVLSVPPNSPTHEATPPATSHTSDIEADGHHDPLALLRQISQPEYDITFDAFEAATPIAQNIAPVPQTTATRVEQPPAKPASSDADNDEPAQQVEQQAPKPNTGTHAPAELNKPASTSFASTNPSDTAVSAVASFPDAIHPHIQPTRAQTDRLVADDAASDVVSAVDLPLARNIGAPGLPVQHSAERSAQRSVPRPEPSSAMNRTPTTRSDDIEMVLATASPRPTGFTDESASTSFPEEEVAISPMDEAQFADVSGSVEEKPKTTPLSATPVSPSPTIRQAHASSTLPAARPAKRMKAAPVLQRHHPEWPHLAHAVAPERHPIHPFAPVQARDDAMPLARSSASGRDAPTNEISAQGISRSATYSTNVTSTTRLQRDASHMARPAARAGVFPEMVMRELAAAPPVAMGAQMSEVDTPAPAQTQAQPGKPDLETLARQVYPLLKRLLAVERERWLGR
jgi:hypothetical protein